MIHEIIPVILSAKSRIVWCGSALKKKKRKEKEALKWTEIAGMFFFN